MNFWSFTGFNRNVYFLLYAFIFHKNMYFLLSTFYLFKRFSIQFKRKYIPFMSFYFSKTKRFIKGNTPTLFWESASQNWIFFFQRSSLGESKETTTKASPTTDSPTEPIYENSSTISEADLKRTNSINIATQTQPDENKSQEDPSLD